MAHHAAPNLTDADTAVLGNRAGPAFIRLLLAGGVCLLLALIFAVFFPGGVQRFAFAYLIGYAFCFAIVLGCLFFTIMTTLFRAGWSGMVRRVAETFAACVPTMAVLFIPLAVYVVSGSGMPYPWAYRGDVAAHSEAVDEHSGDDHAAAHPVGRIRLIAAEHTDDEHAGDHAVGPGPERGEAPGEIATEAKAEVFADGEDHEADNDGGSAHAQDAGHGAGGHGGHHGPPTFTTDNHPDWGWHSPTVQYFIDVKYPWYQGWFWTLRWVIYFGVFSLIGVGFWRLSVRQDRTADPELTNTREKWAPLSVIAFALLVTFMAVDLLMSIDPVYFSTMFAVIFFANCFTAGLATIILALTVLQRRGYLPNVTTDHYHDLGKLLFAFVFFWGYVSFSQFMLQWYASLPETTYWWEIRGGTTASGSLRDGAPPTFESGWSWVLLFLLFFHLLIPFAILLSKHTKRHPTWRVVMAVWMLVVVYVDLYWYVMPALSSPQIGLGYLPIDLLTAAGLVCLLLAAALKRAARHSLVAFNDPRMHESLALDTNVWAPIHPD